MKWLAMSSALALLVAPLSRAHASSVPVRVMLGSGTASGALGSAYWSADSVQMIECYGGWGWMGCTARDAAGLTVSCASTRPEFLKVVSAMSSDAFVLFRWDDSGQCAMLQVANSSDYDPKQ